MRPEQRHVVGGEREHPVERVFQRDPAVGTGHRRQHALGLGQREPEVVRREGQDGRLAVGWVDLVEFIPRQQVCLGHRHRPVAVRADPQPFTVLPEVKVGVLMAQHRSDRLGAPPGERRHRCGPGELVGEWGEGQGLADHPGYRRTPDSRATDDDVGGQVSGVGANTGDPVTRGQDVENLGPVEYGRAPLDGARRAARRPRVPPWRCRPAARRAHRARGPGSAGRTGPADSAGSSNSAPGTPQDRANPSRRSSSANRAGVVAISNPPTGR